MKTRWIKTGTGQYVQIFDDPAEGLNKIEFPTETEQIAAAMHYMAEKFSKVTESLKTFMQFQDPDDEEAIQRWETDGGAVERNDDES